MTDVPDTPQDDSVTDVPDTSSADPDGEATPPDTMPDAMAEMLDQLPPDDPAPVPVPTTPRFDELNPAVQHNNPAALSLLFDLTLPVAIELGRTRMSVEDILALGRGSVIQLERLAGEPIDVFVGDRRFAEGEVVVVGEQFGIRITQILAPHSVPEGEVA